MINSANLHVLKTLFYRTSLALGVVFIYFAALAVPANAAVCPWSAGDNTLMADFVLSAAGTTYDCSDVSLTIPATIILTLDGNAAAGEYAALQLANLDIQSGGTITATGEGWVRTSGPTSRGTGGGTCAASYGGGSYGGVGGSGAFGGVGGPTYGSVTAPIDFGSTGCGLSAGGAAGGIVRLDVIGTFNNDGSVVANGVQASNSAGASGGSVYITAATATGTGYIGARGANGWMNYEGGGGGGGRISVVAETITASYSYSVAGGIRASSAGGGNGTVGTIYEDDGAPDITDMYTTPAAPFDTDSVTLTVDALDNDNLGYIKVFLDSTGAGALQNNCVLGGVSSASCQLVTGMLSAGAHTIYAESQDVLAHTVQDSQTFWVFDSLSPDITDISATPGTPALSDAVTISGSASDADGIDYITVYLDSTAPGSVQQTCDLAAPTSGSCDFAVGQIAAGQHEIIVLAADESGATTQDSAFFTVVGDSSPSVIEEQQCSAAGSVTLKSPNGGETLLPGATRSVTWQAQGCNMTSAKLKLSTDGGLTFGTTVATVSNPAAGLYSWMVPYDINSASVRMRIELLGTAGILASDMSDTNFTIGEPVVEEPVVCEVDTWTCRDWNACVAGEQTRMCEIEVDCPDDTTTLAPIEVQACTVVPACVVDDWSCTDWDMCRDTGIQERVCSLNVECIGSDEVKPKEWKVCEIVPVPEPESKPVPEPEPTTPPVVQPTPQPAPKPYTPPSNATPSGSTGGQPVGGGENTPPATDSADDSIYSRLMRNQQLTAGEALAGMRSYGLQVNAAIENLSDEAMARYFEVNVHIDECENMGLVVTEDCVEYLSSQNDGVFPGCENLSEADCEALMQAALIGYMPRDFLADVDEVINSMAASGQIQAIPGITAINPDSAAAASVQMVQSIQQPGAQTSPFVMFIAPSAEQKLANWTPPAQFGQPRGNGEIDGGFSAQAALQGEDSLAGLEFSGYCEPDMVCYLFLYSYVPVVTAISTDENGKYTTDLGDAVSDGRHLAQVVTTDKQGNVVKKSEPEPFYVREGKAVDEGMYLGEGLYEGLTDDIIPAETFIKNIRQYALLVILMFVFIVGLGWASVARRRRA